MVVAGIVFAVLGVGSASWASPIPGGYPNQGTLESGSDLFKVIQAHPDILSSRSPEEFQFGTAQMGDAILAIGGWAKELKRQPVWIGDISKKGGGQLARHLTHQRGLDADIAYLVLEHKPTGHRWKRFNDRFTEQFGMKGPLETNFDLESNYRLLEKIGRGLDVQSIYVGCGIYDALEAYDRKMPASIMEHIYAQQGHEDHFHVRLKRPANLTGCSNEWWIDPAKPHKKAKKRSADGKFRDC